MLIQDMVQTRYGPIEGGYTRDPTQMIKSAGVEVYNIPTQEAVYDEWRTRLLSSFFQEDLYPGGPSHPNGAVGKYNYVIGALRFRTLRVREVRRTRERILN